MDWCLYKNKQENFDTEADTHREKMAMRRQRAEIEVTPSQAKEQLGPPATGTGKKQFFSRDWREHDPDNTLILEFKPPEVWENKFLSFYVT